MSKPEMTFVGTLGSPVAAKMLQGALDEILRLQQNLRTDILRLQVQLSKSVAEIEAETIDDATIDDASAKRLVFQTKTNIERLQLSVRNEVKYIVNDLKSAISQLNE